MKQRIILHIDMNSYFASVEQQANPFLRGRAVGVCAYLSPGGVIIASSMEAKKKGIKTGCKVRDAQMIDPHVILLENEPAKYHSITKKIFNIFSKYTDTVEPYSIDEAFLDLSGWVKNLKEAEFVGQKIQGRIKKEVGIWLNSSVGVSFTKFLAKFAGDIAPKKSVLKITKDNIDEFLRNRNLQDAWGINYRTEERLKKLGIDNLLDLKKYDKDKIRRALGRYGFYLWAGVNGVEISSINQGSILPKSIGHSYCLPKWTSNKEALKTILYKLTEKTGRRLRTQELEAERIHLELAYAQEGGIRRSFKTPNKLFTTEDIFEYAKKFLNYTELAMPIRMLAISVSALSPVSSQMSFFEDNLSRKNLSRAMDNLNNKYGEYTVIYGAMYGTEEQAQDRIGFRKTINI